MSELTHGVFDIRPDAKVDITPPDELTQLREQNRVLQEVLGKVCLELECSKNPSFIQTAAWLRERLEAALTATSQPISKKGDYSHHPAFDEYGEHR